VNGFRNARTARSRDRPPRPAAGDEGARFEKVEAHRGDLRWPLPKDFVRRLERKTVAGSAGAGNIYSPICLRAMFC